MAVVQPKPVGLTDVVLRDAHQSLLATRMRTEDMLPMCEALDNVGYFSLEVWGGATFDTALRFLNEDPWERLRLLRQHTKKTKLQMLLRGQNVVGYRNYADDVVERFCYKAAENGIDIFRIFDALNDLRNIEVAMRAVRRVGAHAQGTICYTISPVHTIEGFVEMAKRIEEMGADSICVKDMAGLISPPAAYELVKRLKEEVQLPIALHSHHTSGMASMALLKAIEAGVDAVDTAISTLALGTSHPPTETIISALRGTSWDTGLDLEQFNPIAKHFAEVRKRYAAFDEQIIGVDTNVLTYQVPGGMISNLIAQLKEQNALDRLPEVLAEVPRVREDLGYPPLVTPSSQFVGTQAVLNVLLGERYKVIPKEVQLYLLGYYGQPPAPVNPRVRELACGEKEVITARPGEILPPELEKAKAEISGWAQSEEDVLSYALFPQVAKEFFEKRARGAAIDAEVVAAIAGVLARENSVARGANHHEQAPVHGASLWKLAGRQAALRRWGR